MSIPTNQTPRLGIERDLVRAMVASSNFACIATDEHGVIQLFNNGAERMLGYASAEVINAFTPADISDPAEMQTRSVALSKELGSDIRPGLDVLVFKAARGIEDIYELTYIRKDGSRLPAVVSVTALRDEDGVIIGYLLIGTDNTARRKVEDERRALETRLQHKNDELESANRMKSEFLANMSHELRTPLNAIVGFSEILRDGLMGDMNERQRSCVDDIFTSGKHLLSVINDILDLSKVEAGHMELDLEEVPASPLFLDSLSVVRERASGRNISLSAELPEDMDHIVVDARKVKQIVYNLLANAVKFTTSGGQVKIRVERVGADRVGMLRGDRPGRTIPLEGDRFAEYLAISVADSGIGMSERDLERLFVPFTQMDSSLTRRFEGTGLGLAIVKRLAELHGGTVAVESAENVGSRFTVWLPLRSSIEQAGTPVPQPPEVHSEAEARTALVVEDDPKSAALIKLQLEAEGFSVVVAGSAEEGLAVAARRPLALITLDILLPEMNGWEFLRRLKSLPVLNRVPVVIISIAVDRNKGFALGAAAVIEKPTDRQELFGTLVDLGLFPLSQLHELRILVVDDDPMALDVTAARLHGLASNVLTARGGLAGIESAQREQPDLILLDLMMPEVSGFEVVEALGRDSRTALIPIIVLTSDRITAADRAVLNSHVKAIVEKSDHDQGRLGAEIRRALWSRKAPA